MASLEIKDENGLSLGELRKFMSSITHIPNESQVLINTHEDCDDYLKSIKVRNNDGYITDITLTNYVE